LLSPHALLLYCPCTAATLHEFEGMSDLHRELATLRLSPADLQSSLAQAAKEAEEEQRKGELCAVLLLLCICAVLCVLCC
jgi:hypothetical protein